jgi:hypothetical protein
MLLQTLFTWHDQQFLNGIFSLLIQRGERKRPFGNLDIDEKIIVK